MFDLSEKSHQFVHCNSREITDESSNEAVFNLDIILKTPFREMRKYRMRIVVPTQKYTPKHSSKTYRDHYYIKYSIINLHFLSEISWKRLFRKPYCYCS